MVQKAAHVRIAFEFSTDDCTEAQSVAEDMLERLRQRLDFWGFDPNEAPISGELTTIHH